MKEKHFQDPVVKVQATGWRNTYMKAAYSGAELRQRHLPDSARDSALQQQNFFNHWLLIHVSWQQGNSPTQCKLKAAGNAECCGSISSAAQSLLAILL